MSESFSRLDRPHRTFTVAAAAWTLTAPWFASDRCWDGGVTIRGHIGRIFGGPSCDGLGIDLLVAFMICAVPSVIAYLLLFVTGPAIVRWIAAGATSSR